MKYKERISNGLRLLASPKEEYAKMEKRTFESVLEDYIKLLLLSGLLASVASFVITIARAAYLNLFKNITVDYYKLANYSLGTSTNIFFLYLFCGTALVALITFFVKIFAGNLKYVKAVSVVLYALTPVLFFGWINGIASLTLLLWTIFLIYVGITTLKSLQPKKK
ncbi:MAG TPA: YIP1 family protein [Alphaproteobacteria bacterium]|nr:YIP1 family protein [Alphaproteobacteria bacterium]